MSRQHGKHKPITKTKFYLFTKQKQSCMTFTGKIGADMIFHVFEYFQVYSDFLPPPFFICKNKKNLGENTNYRQDK